MNKYTSDYTTNELLDTGNIEEGIKDLVDTLTNRYNIKTTLPFSGHLRPFNPYIN